ncbi:Transferase protein [Dioscorea alata]|uniref:Transferase protein n=1 Tax=Dioscorea alata TaxID=55571 RepID=A0ACB7V4J1_DIOAL|nr:Transferase protein [Dioscorea alata]
MTPSRSSGSPTSSSTVTIISKSTVYPDRRSDMADLKLSVSDLPMLSCHYIQKGLLFLQPPFSFLSLLTQSLSRALSIFPALAGRLTTRPDGRIFISCNDAGADLIHAIAPSFTASSVLPACSDTPPVFKEFFALDRCLSYEGHIQPLAAFQITELGDSAVFIGCTVNHALVDGTSFWNFFNAWAELCRTGGPKVSLPPDFRRNYFGDSKAVLDFPDGAVPKPTFPVDDPIRERIFHFTREAILQLKDRANLSPSKHQAVSGSMEEIYGKQTHDRKADEISSFQSLCAQLWISVTRARVKHLSSEATTTFRMAVNCRHRLAPPVGTYYFGNAIQSIPTTASVGQVAAKDLRWVAGLLHRNVLAYNGEQVRKAVAEWEVAPRCFPLGNPDGAGITMGSSPRFPMYDNDFGWGRPLAARSGRANKFDGKISAFPGRDRDGSVDLEVCLAPETMTALLDDHHFMQYVSQHAILPAHSSK